MATYGKIGKSTVTTFSSLNTGPLSPHIVRVTKRDGNASKSNWGQDLDSDLKISEIKNLKVILGENFKIIEDLRDSYVSKIDKLEKKIDLFDLRNRELEEKNKELVEKMESYLVGIPPMPDKNDAVKITDSKQLLKESIKTDSYRNKYLKNESTSNMNGRIELIAYLDIVKDFGNEDYNLNFEPEDYFDSAIDNTDSRIDSYIMEAREHDISLVRYINDVVLPKIII